MAKIGDLRRRLGRPRHGRLLRGARPRRRRSATSCRRRSRRSARGEVPFHEDGLPELLERNRERLTFTLDVGRGSPTASFLFVCVDTPPTYSGDADLSRVWTVSTSCRRSTAAPIARDEVDGAGRNRREGAPRPRCARPVARRLRLEPGVPRRGQRRARLHASRPDRRRRVRRRRTATPSRRSTTAIDAQDRALRRQLGRDDQARRERVPDDADLVHQRDRQRLRGDRRRRRQGRRGRRPRPPARPAFPARRDRLRRLVLPEGLARAQAARLELGLPLPAPARR